MKSLLSSLRRGTRALSLRLTCQPAIWAGARSVVQAASLKGTSDDVVFVTPPRGTSGWILEAICREIASRLDEKVVFAHAYEPLPRARTYFFSHYMYFVNAISFVCPPVGGTHVFATHLEPDKHGMDDRLIGLALARCDSVMCMNRELSQTLMRLGVAEDALHVVVGASDSGLFRPHRRSPTGTVGLSSAFYERKSPDLVVDVVKRLPHRQFLLLGQGWRRFARFGELAECPNFEYVEAQYSEYPRQYERMSVFLSTSRLEGGPIPLLEAMMSNAVPVCSRTGFAPDVIEHGRNGFLFDVDADAATVCSLIERAFALDGDVHSTVEACDWWHYSRKIAGIMGLRSLANNSRPGIWSTQEQVSPSPGHLP